MSSLIHKRKQELLARLAESRLEMLDESAAFAEKIEGLLNFSAKVRQSVKKHPYIYGTVALSLGFLVSKSLLKPMLVKESASIKKHVASVGLIKNGMLSLWGIALASATPIIREFVSDMIRRKLNSLRK